MKTNIIAAILLVALAGPALAEVHFGSHVRIGGHDVSNRTYGSLHIRVVPRLSGPPGCRIIPHGSYRHPARLVSARRRHDRPRQDRAL